MLFRACILSIRSLFVTKMYLLKKDGLQFPQTALADMSHP